VDGVVDSKQLRLNLDKIRFDHLSLASFPRIAAWTDSSSAGLFPANRMWAKACAAMESREISAAPHICSVQLNASG
jgi:hypothetical protein